MASFNRVFVPRVGTQMRAIPRGGVLVNTRSGAVFELNTVATEVWLLLSDGRPFGEICDRVAELHAVDRGVVESDIKTLLDSLTQLDLVTAVVTDAES